MGMGNSVRSIRVQSRGSTAIAVVMAGVFGLAAASNAAEVRHQQGEWLKPNGKGWGELDPSGVTERNAARFAKPTSNNGNNGIFYHGGPLMLGTPNVYYIWYGNWDSDTAKTLLPAFAGGLNNSAYFQINSTYDDGSNVSVSGLTSFAGQATDNYSQGTALSDAAVQNVVQNAISGGSLPLDPNGVYFVLTSADVNETSGFCTQYCAWHNHGTINGANIKYGFIGNPARCPTACSGQQGATPNGNLGADGMANLIAHELSESVTDPNLDAWFDRRGFENADKCAWTFGTTQTASNGSKYNVTLGNYRLVQQNWVNTAATAPSVKIARILRFRPACGERQISRPLQIAAIVRRLRLPCRRRRCARNIRSSRGWCRFIPTPNSVWRKPSIARTWARSTAWSRPILNCARPRPSAFRFRAPIGSSNR